MDIPQFILLALASFAAGIVNAIAGGGTLITFPMLTALGVPAVVANVTNTIALSPGYLGGTIAQRNDLKGQGRRLWVLLPVSLIGGIAGGFLLLQTGEKHFRTLVPYLILFASFMLILQPHVRKWISRIQQRQHVNRNILWMGFLTMPSAIYGGYFGAGVSVIIIATLGAMIDDSLTRLNAVKQVMAFVINVSTALFFIFSASFNWTVVLVMAVGSVLGGAAGGKLAGKIKPETLRWIIVVIGFVVSIFYLVK